MNYTYHRFYDMDVINLRFFTVYGERQRPNLAIHKFVRSVFNGLPITVYGNGETERGDTYYADIVNGIIAAIDYISQNKGVWETFNLGNHSPVSLMELVSAIAKAASVQPNLVYEPMKPGDVNITYASIEKAKRILGYDPKISLRIGLANFINWYKTELVHQAVK
jgi:UDP-glucuronate 4-epimerase